MFDFTSDASPEIPGIYPKDDGEDDEQQTAKTVAGVHWGVAAVSAALANEAQDQLPGPVGHRFSMDSRSLSSDKLLIASLPTDDHPLIRKTAVHEGQKGYEYFQFQVTGYHESWGAWATNKRTGIDFAEGGEFDDIDYSTGEWRRDQPVYELEIIRGSGDSSMLESALICAGQLDAILEQENSTLIQIARPEEDYAA